MKVQIPEEYQQNVESYDEYGLSPEQSVTVTSFVNKVYGLMCVALLITAGGALDQGKEVFAVPGRITDPVSAGCNRLIAQGAWPLFSMDDLPEMLGLSCPGADSEAKEAAPLAGDEKLVADLLDVTPVSFEEILEKSGFSYSRLSSILLKLQLKGAAREVAKNLYARGAI